MSYLANRAFWMESLERATKTFAQALVGTITSQSLLAPPETDWRLALSLSTTAAFVSLLTSIASGKIGPANSPCLTTPAPRRYPSTNSPPFPASTGDEKAS